VVEGVAWDVSVAPTSVGVAVGVACSCLQADKLSSRASQARVKIRALGVGVPLARMRCSCSRKGRRFKAFESLCMAPSLHSGVLCFERRSTLCYRCSVLSTFVHHITITLQQN